MEKRISAKVDAHQLGFKNSIKDWVEAKINPENENDYKQLIQYVFDFENVVLQNEDFQKRKRVKNAVPQYERCDARRANAEQCTRRKKEGSCYCGTHVKGTPHGIIVGDGKPVDEAKKIEVRVQEIKGINYYIDDNKNVYLPEDIISSRQPPRRIGKWVLDNGEYSIPDLEAYA